MGRSVLGDTSLDPRVRFRAALSDRLIVAIVAGLIEASKDAYENCRTRHSRFPLTHVLGQDRYYALQEAYLAVQEQFPELTIRLERHPFGHGSYYVVLVTPLVRMTIAKVKNLKSNPPLKLFRRGYSVQRHRPGQLELPGLTLIPPPKGQLISALVFGYEGDEYAAPAFMEARFVNEGGFYMSETVDLMEIYRQSLEIKVEEIGSPPPPRVRRTERDRKPNESA
jgi:hypothetical protein